MSDYNFDPELACIIGVDESIMVHNLVFWIRKNRANNKHFYKNRYWTYNTVEAFKELFPFWTTKQLRRIMESLYNQKVIIKDTFNTASFDRTGWYALTDEFIYLLGSMHLPDRTIPNAEKGNTIPNSKPNKKTFTKKVKVRSPMVFVKPTLKQVIDFFEEKGYSETGAKKAFDYYEASDVDGQWYDASGSAVISWKMKMITSWLKDEYKTKIDSQERIKF